MHGILFFHNWTASWSLHATAALGTRRSRRGAMYPESEVQSIVIDVSDREVEVCASDSEEIVISYYESEKEYYDTSPFPRAGRAVHASVP